ncbi:PAS domain-containing protein [Polyangium aurulentum]|uniref:PAS domain-containing protein n=1 Tax=Polyangium aurulentum TaxID=2567896 RepID=UPI0010AEDC3D|nr:PAS domain-containing protein [Polyangium aurulentum]UQA55254.1 PAS domain-containing protein [Polyangium aurulentum]
MNEHEAERDALRAEVERLRSRLVEVEKVAAAAAEQLAEGKRMEVALKAKQAVLQAFLDNTPALMFAKDAEGRYVVANGEYARCVGVPVEEILGKRTSDVSDAETAAAMEEADRRALAEGRLQFVRRMPHVEGPRVYLSVKFAIPGDAGPMGVGTVGIDVTREREAEDARAVLQEKVIAAQEATIRELTTPLLPITDGIVAMPLVGGIDAARAQQIIEALLDGITRYAARAAILDVTGVRVVDTHVAHALVQAAQAASLLGTRVVLTGMSPAIARTLVELGADLQGIATVSTLRAGIDWAVKQR